MSVGGECASSDRGRGSTYALVLSSMWLSGLGLCRTCEIFGVCELVLANLAVVEDPQFTALSVSSQHWLKISEVSKTAISSSTYAVCMCLQSHCI